MPKRGKNYRATLEKFDKTQQYEVSEAIKLACETSRAKFDETIEGYEIIEKNLYCLEKGLSPGSTVSSLLFFFSREDRQ